MRIGKLLTIANICLVAICCAAAPAWADGRPKVVATFTILADMTQRIGGTLIDLHTLVGPSGDAHVFDPRPSDARALGDADLVISNGLGFESFLPGLVASTGYAGNIITATAGIAARPFDSGDKVSNGDPHAWHDLTNAAIYIANIANGLAQLDAGNADTYRANAQAYLAEISRLDSEIKARFAIVPENRRLIVTSHDAFGYFGRAYGLTFLGAGGVSTAIEPSAGKIAELIDTMRAAGVRALFVETLVNPDLVAQIARETDVNIGGALFADTLSDVRGPAPTYLEMMRYNAATIASALIGG